MVKLYDGGVYLVGGNKIVEEKDVAKVQELTGQAANKAEAKKGTIAYSILSAHNVSDNMDKLRIKLIYRSEDSVRFCFS